MNPISFVGPFKEHIQNHIDLKQSLGYKYVTEAVHLKRFDLFTAENYYSATTLTKEIVLNWCSKKSYEAQENQCSRASMIRQFSLYLDNIGVKAYIMPKNYYPSGSQYVPHIFSVEELNRFFRETEKCHFSSECPDRQLIMPVLFRMLYACGLRVSEARLLAVADVDLNTGILTIHQSKKDKSRLVPMSASLVTRCRHYSAALHHPTNRGDYYFSAPGGKPITLVNVYRNFRRFLWKAGISHGGRGNGPRVQDFRHTFAVQCLKKWTEEGKDLMVYLPILKTYLGHDSFEETAYYLRLTADVFPSIILKLETLYPHLIPELVGDIDETN